MLDFLRRHRRPDSTRPGSCSRNAHRHRDRIPPNPRPDALPAPLRGQRPGGRAQTADRRLHLRSRDMLMLPKRREDLLNPHIWDTYPWQTLDLVVLRHWPGVVRQTEVCRRRKCRLACRGRPGAGPWPSMLAPARTDLGTTGAREYRAHDADRGMPDQAGRIYESAAVALDGWITGNAGCTAPAGMAHFETARFRSAYSGANSCRFSLHWGVVRCSQFPGAARFPLAGLAFHAGTFLAAAPPSRADGIRTRYRRRHASAPHGLSPAEQLRSAADIWPAIRKEATSCRTSREEQPGRIS